jgi:DNA-binding transcriptional LysR family regulator
MNIEFVKTFLALASAENISKASDALNLTQATISLQLKSLEKELGFTLFERHRGCRRLKLTQKGYDFWFIAEKLIKLSQEAYSLRNKHEHKLTVSSVDSLSNYSFFQFYNQIIQENIPINLQIFNNRSSEIYSLVENHSIDVGFVQKYYNYPNLNITPIFREKMQIAFSPSFNDIPPVPIHPKDLNFEREILIDWGDAFMQWHNTWCNPNILPSVQAGNTTIGLRFLQEGGYWTILPYSVIKHFQPLSPIKTYPLLDPPPDRICYKLTHRVPDDSSTPGINILEKYLDDYLKLLQKRSYIFALNNSQ